LVPSSDRDASIEGVALLRDPLRRAIYDYVVRSAEPVGRDAVAAEVEASRSLVAFHLDKLVALGLLRTSFRRLSGRAGPGAGRPAKLYERSDRQLEVSLPGREYELAAHLLLTAVAGKGNVAERVRVAARELGESTGARELDEHGAPRSRAASLDRMEPVLDRFGYEPFREGRVLCLRNCPFHALVEQSPDLVCGMNLALIEGLLAGMRSKGLGAELAPSADRCCVEIREVSG
jgi:predicted ArsR family transcriptional regulator